MGMTLTKSGNKYEAKFRWVIGTTKLSVGTTYRLMVEVYTTLSPTRSCLTRRA